MLKDLLNSDRAGLPPATVRPGAWGPWLLLLIGLLVYVGMQSYLSVSPLRNWTLVPEVKDGLTYVLKSQQMLECFQQNCPALNDLHEQLFGKGGDEPVGTQADKQRI